MPSIFKIIGKPGSEIFLGALTMTIAAAGAGCASPPATPDAIVETREKDPSWYSRDSRDLRINSVDDRYRLREVWSQNSADRYPEMSKEDKVLRGVAYGIPISF